LIISQLPSNHSVIASSSSLPASHLLRSCCCFPSPLNLPQFGKGLTRRMELRQRLVLHPPLIPHRFLALMFRGMSHFQNITSTSLLHQLSCTKQGPAFAYTPQLLPYQVGRFMRRKSQEWENGVLEGEAPLLTKREIVKICCHFRPE
jgi:hypothetical protein